VAVKLLCVGDIHLGRRPSGLTDQAAEHVAARDLSPAAVWRSVVDQALHRQVDAVLLAGDVVEQRDDFYEAYGALAAGVTRLVEANVRVLGVTGNHDGLVLPRLANAIPEFKLLGREGHWEFDSVSGRDGSEVRVLGWSFPGEVATVDPFADSPDYDGSEMPTIGLLHCDRDSSSSRYAPVRSSTLRTHWADAWLLGHIHKPDQLTGPRPVGYLGALTALDPSDVGPRGPWIVETARRGQVEIEHLALAPLRFEHLVLDVSDLDGAEGLERFAVDAIADLHARIAISDAHPRAVGVRFRLTGRTDVRPALEAECDRMTNLAVPHDGTLYFVQKATNDTVPTRDLQELATGGQDPYSLLSARVLLLDRPAGDPERRTLIRAAKSQLERVRRKNVYTRLSDITLDDEEIAARLRTAALSAMDRLAAQRETGS